MVADKMVLDKMVRTKWHNFIFCVHFNLVEFDIIFSSQKSQINDKNIEESYRRQSGSGIDEKIILSMGAGLIDDFIRNILSLPLCPYHFVQCHFVRIPFCPYHFVRTILSATILS